MFQDTGRKFPVRMIAGLLVTAAFLTIAARTSIAQTNFEVLHLFNKAGDAQSPTAGVQADAAGNLFGSAEFGGANSFGAIFMLKPPPSGETNWTETVIFSFADGDDGGFPGSPLFLAGNDELVSSTLMGGTANNGAIFRLSPPANGGDSWTEKVLFNFQGIPDDGSGPLGPLFVRQNGTIFGTTSSGGASNCGTAYRLTPASGSTFEENVIFNFTCGADGGRPQVGLVTDNKGALFGTTETNGTLNNGVIFQLTPPVDGSSDWKETTIFAFDIADGAQPVGNLLAFHGSLYGVTFQGGQFGQGVVFQLTPPAKAEDSWSETVLHSFSGGTDGGEPQSGLLSDGKDGFFGAASEGGTTGNGNFFHLAPPAQAGGAWTLTPLHQFDGNDGSTPSGELLKHDGAIFGTTEGSVNGSGSVYKIVP